MPTLFTNIHEESCGFTDQLAKLATVHDIGTRCGYEFRLTPFGGVRSDPGFWSHYDLSRAFRVITPAEAALDSVRITFPEGRVRDAGIGDLSDLLRYVTSRVPDHVRLVEFDTRRATNLRGLLPREPSPSQEEFQSGIRSVFTPQKVWSPSRGLRVLVHLRCGDVTDIPLVGPISYRLWGRDVSVARPFWPTPFLGARLVVDTVRAGVAPAPADVRVFSDGYARTRRHVARSADRGGTTTRATRDILLRAVDIHEEAAASLFRGTDAAFSMGESFDSLQNLIDSAQQADLIVITHAQRMLPKFLAVLGARERAPGMLVLETPARGAKHRRGVGLHESVAGLITLSPHGDPLAPLQLFLAERSVPEVPEAVCSTAEQAGAGLYCVSDVESLAASLENTRPDLAMVGYRRLARLTDGSPSSHAGVARCAKMLGDLAVAEEARACETEASARCVAGYRAAIDWARRYGSPHDIAALVEDARAILESDVDLSATPP